MAYVPPHARKKQDGAGARKGSKLLPDLAKQVEGRSASSPLPLDQRNTFVSIVSPSFDDIQATIWFARDTVYIKAECGLLDAKHYHFTVALELSTLLQALIGPHEDEKEKAKVAILTQMADGDVEVPIEMIDAFKSKPLTSAYPDGLGPDDWLSMRAFSSVHLKVGYILKKFLLLYSQSHPAMFEKYIMVGGLINGKAQLELNNLPGGTRFMGESAIENAIRKTEAECSIQIHKEWMTRVAPKYRGFQTDRGDVGVIAPVGKMSMNAFFVMAPPPSSL